jgi:glycosyltransferase involved in cell wall biosynthesis
MKIVYIITRSDVLGGASVHLLDLAKGMIEKGHQVHILVGGTGAFTEALDKNNIGYSSLIHLKRELSIQDEVLGYFEIKKQLERLNPDIVHCHSTKAGLLGRLAAKSLNIPVVFTAHGWAFTDGVGAKKQKIYAAIERGLSKLSDAIITVSEYDRQHGFKHNVGTQQLVTTVHNGVPDVIKSINTPQNPVPKLIMVARFEEPKDQYFLINALAELPKNLDWRLDLIGDGPNLQKCKDLTKSKQLDNKITFHGQSFKVQEFLNQADIFILISKYEGFPLTILEAMRASLPIIASDVGGVKESVNPNNGFLIAKNDSNALRTALVNLISDAKLRAQLGNNSRKAYEENFTFDIMLDKTLAIYNKILAQRDLR